MYELECGPSGPCRPDKNAIAEQQADNDEVADSAGKRVSRENVVGISQQSAGKLRESHRVRMLAKDEGEHDTPGLPIRRVHRERERTASPPAPTSTATHGRRALPILPGTSMARP
jgi:hypothetical protein